MQGFPLKVLGGISANAFRSAESKAADRGCRDPLHGRLRRSLSQPFDGNPVRQRSTHAGPSRTEKVELQGLDGTNLSLNKPCYRSGGDAHTGFNGQANSVRGHQYREGSAIIAGANALTSPFQCSADDCGADPHSLVFHVRAKLTETKMQFAFFVRGLQDHPDRSMQMSLGDREQGAANQPTGRQVPPQRTVAWSAAKNVWNTEFTAG